MQPAGHKRILKASHKNSESRHNILTHIIAVLLLMLIIILLICQITPLCKIPWQIPHLQVATNKTNQTTPAQEKTQFLQLKNDVLSITSGNAVDLSIYKYHAGIGLKLNNNTFYLNKTGVTPGYYGSAYTVPVFHVDSYGRITSITQIPLAKTSTTYTAGNGISISNTTISVNAPTCQDNEKLLWTGTEFKCVPDLTILDSVVCGKDEILQYNGGTWVCTKFIPHSIFDTDKDTGIETEHTPDEDIIGFYTAGNQVEKIDSSGNFLFSSIDLTDLMDINPFTGMLFRNSKGALRIGFTDDTSWDDTNIGNYSFATGYNPIASGKYTLATGYNTKATGVGAIAGNNSTTASGDYSFAMGNSSIANSYLMSVFGQYNITSSGQDQQNWQPTDFLFVIGNGTDASHKHNALTILKNGYIGLGDHNPVANLVIGDDTNANYVSGLGDVYIQNNLEVDGTIYANHLQTNLINLPTFSPGSVLFIDNNRNIAENPSNFFWDFTNNFLGLGTNNPQERLDINGNIRIQGNIYPAQDSTFNLGSNTNRWKDLYLSGTTIHIGQNGNEGAISYDTTNSNLQVHAKQISLLGPNNSKVNITDSGITLNVGQSGNIFKLITSNIINGIAKIGDVLSVKNEATGEMDFRHITELEEGTATGQLLYWDNTAKIYKHSLEPNFNDNTRRFIVWKPDVGLYLGQQGGSLIAPDEILTVAGNIHFLQRYNHTTPKIFGVNKNNFIAFSSYYGSPTTIKSVGSTVFQTYNSNQTLSIQGANIHITGNYVNTNLVTLDDSNNQRVIILGGQTYNNHLNGISLELLGNQPRPGSGAIYGGNIRLDGGLGRDSLPFENGKVLIGTRTQYTKIGIGTDKPKGFVDVVEPVINYTCPTPSSISASSTYPDGNHNINNAIDNNENTAWASENNQASLPSIIIEYPTAQKMEKVTFSYHITDSILNSYKYAPRTVSVAGSNDGATWTPLKSDAQLYANWNSSNETKTFHIASSTAYKYYKFSITSTAAWNNDHTQTLTGLYELKFCYIASTTATRTLFINNGLVGIGTSNPTELLQVGNPGDGTVAIANAWTTFSDSRLKKNIVPIDRALEKIQHLQGVYYNWKYGQNRREIGLIAQQVQKIVPEVVYQRKEFMSIDYSKLTALLINAVKELADQTNSKFTELFNIIKGPKDPKDPLYNSPNIGLLKALTWTKYQIEFLRKTIFDKAAVFDGIAQFNKPVTMNDRVTFNDYDMAGSIVIPAKQKEVKITFAKEYNNVPIVIVTAYDAKVRYGIKDITTKGFTIYMTRSYRQEKRFNWIVINNKNPHIQLQNQ